MDNVIKISEHFWIIEDNGVRSFLFEGDERAMLVDTGFGTLRLRELVTELTELPIIVVNTHTDKDHTGRNRDFKSVYMHPAEMDHYKNTLPEGCHMEDVSPLWEGDIDRHLLTPNAAQTSAGGGQTDLRGCRCIVSGSFAGNVAD